MKEIHNDIIEASTDTSCFGAMQTNDDHEISILKWQLELLLKTIDDE